MTKPDADAQRPDAGELVHTAFHGRDAGGEGVRIIDGGKFRVNSATLQSLSHGVYNFHALQLVKVRRIQNLTVPDDARDCEPYGLNWSARRNGFSQPGQQRDQILCRHAQQRVAIFLLARKDPHLRNLISLVHRTRGHAFGNHQSDTLGHNYIRLNLFRPLNAAAL